MKIIHITNYLPNCHSNWGGAEQACYRIMKLEKQAGHQITVITTKPEKPIKEFNSFTVKLLEDLSPIIASYKAIFPYDSIACSSLKRILKKSKPDIIHLHNFNKISFAAIKAAKTLNIPTVYSIYDYWSICPVESLIDYKNNNCKKYHSTLCKRCLSKRKFALMQSFLVKFRKSYFNKYLKKINKFIVLSNSSKNILKNYGIKESRIKVIHLPLDIKAENQSKEKSEKNSILYTAWLQPRKGLHILIKSMPYILKTISKAKLYVIGSEGPEKKYKKEIINFIKENNLEKNIILLGKKSPEEVNKYLKKTNVTAVPEQWENMSPLIVMEAMALSKPIVASRIGGIPEFIIHNKTGLLSEHNNPEDFAKNITKILKNTKLAEKLGTNSKKKFRETFNNTKIIENLLNTYKSLL